MKRTRLDVSEAMRDFAKQLGAYFDKKTGSWYVDGEVPFELEELATPEQWKSYTGGPVRASKLATVGLEAGLSANSDKKKLPSELLERISALTTLVESLAGDRAVAIGWLQTPKLALGRRTPLEVMVDLRGCDQVEKLMRESFSS